MELDKELCVCVCACMGMCVCVYVCAHVGFIIGR